VTGKEIMPIVKCVETIYRVRINLPARGVHHNTINGPADMVSDAKREIKESLPPKKSFFIDKKHIGLIIGRGGDTVRALARDLNAFKIDVKNNGEVIIINGGKSACEVSEQFIGSYIEMWKTS